MENSPSLITQINKSCDCDRIYSSDFGHSIQQIRHGHCSALFHSYWKACYFRPIAIFICLQIRLGHVLYHSLDDTIRRSYHLQEFLRASLWSHLIVKHNVFHELFASSYHMVDQPVPDQSAHQEKIKLRSQTSYTKRGKSYHGGL